MIKNKSFGVYTTMHNNTNPPSQIRFGGYNEKLFSRGSELRWMDTVGNNTWKLELQEVLFRNTKILD